MRQGRLENSFAGQKQIPAQKTCAGGITEAAASLIGEKIPPSIIESRCSKFFYAFKEIKQKVNCSSEFMVVVSRDKFDEWLLQLSEKAGAKIQLGKKVNEVQLEKEFIKVIAGRNAYRGRVVVGADGVNSIVARNVRLRFKKKELAFYVCTEVPVDPKKFPLDEVYVRFCFPGHGYGWVFPKQDSAITGIGGPVKYIKNIKANFSKFLANLGIRKSFELRGQYVPIGGIKRQVVAEKIILVGDAAGFADPLTGEGIRYALASGKEAARVIKNIFTSNEMPNAENLAEYQRACRRFIEPDLEKALKIIKLLSYCPEKILKYCLSCMEPIEKFLEIPQGKGNYSKFTVWLAKWLLRQVFSYLKN